MRLHLQIIALSVVSIVPGIDSSVGAQLRSVADPVALPGYSFNAPDSAFAVDLNPAALGWFNSWSAAYIHSEAASDQDLSQRGDGFAAALPLIFNTTLGFSAHSVRPTAFSGSPSYGAASLALAFAPSPLVSLGTALRFVNSSNDRIDGITTLDFALSMRPSPYLASTFMVRDLTSPYYPQGGGSVPRSFILAVATRPFGCDVLTAEAAGSVDSDERTGLRGTLAVNLPKWLRVLGGFEWRRDQGVNDTLATVGLAFDWHHLSLGLGVHRPKHGDHGTPLWYVSAEISGVSRPGFSRRQFALSKELPGSESTIAWVKALYTLERALYDDEVSSVVLRFENEIKWAHAQELREIVERLERADKAVICLLETASAPQWYACSGARSRALDPGGLINLKGVYAQTLLFGETLGRMGVRADVVRIGDYKGAPEQFTQKKLSEPVRQQEELIVDDVYRRVVRDLAFDYKTSANNIKAWVDEGPYTPEAAKRAGLVHRVADVLQPETIIAKVIKRKTAVENDLSDRRSNRWGRSPRLGVLVVDSTLVDGENVDVPFLGIHLSGSQTLIRAIEQMVDDPSIRAIIVRIDSPGGAALAAEQVWRALWRARARKPVFASIGSVAASGGYYIASAAHQIWAAPSALTGSIGIFYGKLDLKQLADKIGLGVEHFKRGRFAGAESMWRPFTEPERQRMQETIRTYYELFLKRVALGRKKSVAEIDRVAQGHVWTADRAKGLGLIDKLGGFATVLAHARYRTQLPDDAEILVLPRRPTSLMDYVVGEPEQSSQGVLGQILGRPSSLWLSQALALGLSGASIQALSTDVVEVD